MQTVTQGSLQSADGVALPLESTCIQAQVAGPLAQVHLEQVFHNPLPTAIEATYLFPLPHAAAVHALRFEVGNRVVEAQLQEKKAAQRRYAQARAEGRRAALLEERRPDLFAMQVGGIQPGETIRVHLHYQQLMEWDDGQYTLIFPLIAADRNSAEEGLPCDVESLRSRRRAASQRDGLVDFTLRLEEEARPWSPTHDLECWPGWVRLSAHDRLPNRDLVLRWRADGLQSVRGGEHFLLSLVPSLEMEDSLAPPRDLLILLDRSCSMQGQTTAQARRALDWILASLTPADRIAVVAFDHEPQGLHEGYQPATPERMRELRAALRDLPPRGGTELARALRECQALHTERACVLLITDATVSNEAEVLAALPACPLFVLGLGPAPNRHLLQALARAGQGACEVLSPFEDPEETLARLARRLRLGGPLVRELRLEWEGEPPLDAPGLPTALYGGQPLTVVGQLGRAEPQALRLTGLRWDGTPFGFRHTLRWQPTDCAGLPRLWARRKVDELLARAAPVPEVVRLALRHQLLTPYTAFVGDDAEVCEGEAQAVEVATPEPAGRRSLGRRVACAASPAAEPMMAKRPESVVRLECRTVSCLDNLAAAKRETPPRLDLEGYREDDRVDELDAALDLVFLIDETGSMGPYIQTVQEHLLAILDEVRALPLCRRLRVGLVRYRDHPPQEPSFVTRVLPLSEDLQAVRRAVAGMQASGGGDGPEAVTDGLFELVGLNWRPESVRAVVWVGDAPPHGVGAEGDGFPRGCPCGRHWHTQAESCREMGIAVYAVPCRVSGVTQEVFQRVARTTRGLCLPLAEAPLLVPLITGVAAHELDKLRLRRAVRQALTRFAAELAQLDEADQAAFLAAQLADLRPRRLSVNGRAVLRFEELRREDVAEALERITAQDAVPAH